MQKALKYFFLFIVLLQWSCTNLKDFRVETVPAFTADTYWLCKQFATDNEAEDLSATYITKVIETTPTHYIMSVSLEDQPQNAYSIRLRRVDLAIDGFIGANDETLDVYMPLLSFPLYKGKVWTQTLKTQDHPRRPVKEIEATFEIKDLVEYNYLPNKNIAAEKRAFRIEMTLPDQTLSYYYLPPDKKFPGTNLVDLYLQLNLLYANSPKIASELLEYKR